MSRVIKFRAWKVNDPEWECDEAGEMFYSCTEEFKRGASLVHIEDDGALLPDEYKWMQFTGIQDRNGVDIYEGDIISHAEYITNPGADVQWLDDAGAWSIGRDWPFSEFYACGVGACEVIGNIHEHPMLLSNKEGE